MNKKIIRKYLIICFGITYISWGLVAYYSRTQQINFNEYTWMLLLYIFGVISPAISAIYIEKKEEGKSWKEIFSNIFKRPRHKSDWLIALGAVTSLQILPFFICGGEKLGSFINLLFLIPIFFIIGGLEEVGWRGFWLEHELLSKEKNKIISVLVIGIVWEIWHLPLFAMLGTYQQLHTNLLLHTISTLAIAFLLGGLYLRSRSTFLCMVVHSMINSLSDILIIKSSYTENILLLIGCVIFFLIINIKNNKKITSNNISERT